MSDLPELGGPRRPGSPPRPEVLQAIIAKGRQRLRRAALGGAGALATVTALVLGVGMLSGGGGADGLVVVPASPVPAVSATPTPGAATPRPEASTPTPEPAAPGARPTPEPRPAGQPSPTAAPRGDDADALAPPDTAEKGQLPEHRERPRRGGTSGDLCQGPSVNWAPEGYRLCMQVRMSTSIPQYAPVSIELELCSSLSSRGPLQLSFRTGREHELQVRPHDELDDYLWTWSRHYRFTQGPHQLDLAPGECLTWTTPWDTRDDEGKVLPPGEYLLEAAVDAEGATQWVQQPFRITAD